MLSNEAIVFNQEGLREKIINQHLEDYYKNDCKILHKMIDGILQKLRFYDVDKEDFYSLANEVIAKALVNYDFKQDFNGYIYSCLVNKFKTEMTRRNRLKRQADKMALSLDSPIGNDEEKSTLGEMIADESTVESDFFEENEDTYSKEMEQYLSRLSALQREVLHRISIGYLPSEIIEELHITQKLYNDCYNAIHSYRNIEVLF